MEIKNLLKTNKLVVETRYTTDPDERVLYCSYHVWLIEDGEPSSYEVSVETIYGDEAINRLYEHEYDSDSDKIYDWTHSTYDPYPTGEDYDNAGWFFIDESKLFFENILYSSKFFLGDLR